MTTTKKPQREEKHKVFGWAVPGGGGSGEQAGLEEAGREDITSNSPLSYSSLFVTAASSYRLFPSNETRKRHA